MRLTYDWDMKSAELLNQIRMYERRETEAHALHVYGARCTQCDTPFFYRDSDPDVMHHEHMLCTSCTMAAAVAAVSTVDQEGC
jgi:hypothetical protein